MGTPNVAVDDPILQHHYNLAPECGELTRELLDGDGAAAFTLQLASPELPRFLADFRYAISSWPLLISAATRQRFADVVAEVPSLLRRGVMQYFGRDRRRFSVHYGLPDSAYEVFTRLEGETRHVLARYDLVLTGDSVRLLEVNVGSKIGGWQINPLWSQLASSIVRRHPSWRRRLSHTNTLEVFCRYIARAVAEHTGKPPTLVLVLLSSFYIDRQLQPELTAVYDRVMGGTAAGRVEFVFDVDATAVSVGPDGRLRHRGRIVDVVMAGAIENVPAEFTTAHLDRLVFCPDNACHRLLADKTNFAMLHAARAAGRLSDADAQRVDAWIPWAALLTDEVVEWHGCRAPAPELARVAQGDLVLKRGVSRQGRDVFVGRFMDAADWAATVDGAGTCGDWLLQQYCAPDPLYAPDDGGDVTPHESVWGVFGLGGEYGGVFGRVMEPVRSRGVVNADRGAKECVILEVRRESNREPTACLHPLLDRICRSER